VMGWGSGMTISSGRPSNVYTPNFLLA
jgi:hypothetical protein